MQRCIVQLVSVVEPRVSSFAANGIGDVSLRVLRKAGGRSLLIIFIHVTAVIESDIRGDCFNCECECLVCTVRANLLVTSHQEHSFKGIGRQEANETILQVQVANQY